LEAYDIIAVLLLVGAGAIKIYVGEEDTPVLIVVLKKRVIPILRLYKAENLR
jgi:hypothetical protein